MNTTSAMRNTVRAPWRSAIQPLIGMKIARLTRYDVSASFRAIGSSWRLTAMLGSAVAITVESVFSMNRAVATVSGTIQIGRWLWEDIGRKTRAAWLRLLGNAALRIGVFLICISSLGPVDRRVLRLRDSHAACAGERRGRPRPFLLRRGISALAPRRPA